MKDPLNMITKLDALTLISRTQVKNNNFLTETHPGFDFAGLERSQKEHFIDLWQEHRPGASLNNNRWSSILSTVKNTDE